ncbi:CcmD family protein [Litoribacter populi]|uniref:CcmD family protein n=1 Tax=Litoribacter populi TaxID=2598460 RepID=UPI00117C6FDE|nr:CcmD family protein [Litoribacter populi]
MQKWFIILFLCFSLNAVAQEKIGISEEDYQNDRIEMADVMRSEGKIYVVVGIIGIIMGGILLYLINTERKITKLEEHFNN